MKTVQTYVMLHLRGNLQYRVPIGMRNAPLCREGAAPALAPFYRQIAAAVPLIKIGAVCSRAHSRAIDSTEALSLSAVTGRQIWENSLFFPEN